VDYGRVGHAEIGKKIDEKTVVDLKVEATERIGTVRDLLCEVAPGAGKTMHRASLFERPEKVLDDRQLR
jgi:hypothetical protein